jgi:molybdenum cofactor synthesis domain-containing protein
MQEFANRSTYPMIPLEEAWDRVEQSLGPLAPVEVPLVDLLGLVLAEDVTATEDMPPFRASRMDGYAVRAEDGQETRQVVGEQDAGDMMDVNVRPGTALRIMTGAPVPDGADAVIPVEDTEERGGRVHLKRGVEPGENIRPIGADIATGDLVLAKGTVIGPAEVGLLATVGRTRVLAVPRPRVAVLATGDELVPPDETPGPGQIRDSNSFALAAAVTATGAVPQRVEQIMDTPEALRDAIVRALEHADMVITSGGVSMGTRDLVKPVLEELGTVHFGRVAVKPGKPLTYATVRNKPVLGLPGFPVSSLVSFENVVRPALRILAGHRSLWRPEVTAKLEHSIRHAPDRQEYQRAVVTERDGVYSANTTGSQASSRLGSLAGANALLRIPRGVGDLEQGAEVTALLINQPEVERTR